MNLLSKGQALLTRLLAKDASPAGPVRFVRKVGGAEVDLTGRCWVGRTVFSRLPVDGGPAIVFGDRDYLVPVTALVGPPVEGDYFEAEVAGTEPEIFRVAKVYDEPAWRYSDSGETIYRIHTKKVKH